MGHSMRSIDAPDAQTQVTDVPKDVLDHFAGPARPMSPADVDAVMRRFKKALVERISGAS